MAVPDNITREDLIKAFHKIDSDGIPKQAESQLYDVIYNDKKYPPKLVISYANFYANGTELNRDSFIGGLDKPAFRLLKKYGFTIVKKENGISIEPRSVFVFTSSNADAQRHLHDTIENPIDRNILKQYLSPEDLKKLDATKAYYAWGAIPGSDNLKRWNTMNEGDIVINYSLKNYRHHSTVALKTRNKELAKRLWKTDKNGNTWELMYFLFKPHSIVPPVSSESSADYLQSSYRGFWKINDEKTKLLFQKFGTIDNFFKTFQGNSAPFLRMEFSPISEKYRAIITAIRTKPFILLAGISGTGKSRIVRTLAYRTCIHEHLQADVHKPGNFELIPVRPNWHDSTELLGYVSRISGKPEYIVTDFLRFLVKAWKYSEVPFFVCLDEMNLAPVEQYFAESLSLLETRTAEKGTVRTDALLSAEKLGKDVFEQLLQKLDVPSQLAGQFRNQGITLPPNFVVMGTVNMDETTHSFSRKVLDRAMTIEMNQVDLSEGLAAGDPENDVDAWRYNNSLFDPSHFIGDITSISDFYPDFPEGAAIVERLKEINEVFEGTPFKFAFRIRNEFLLYCYHNSRLEHADKSNWLDEAFDELICMKILPRIEGDEDKAGRVLNKLQPVFRDQYPRSASKLKEMADRLKNSEYTSFWA